MDSDGPATVALTVTAPTWREVIDEPDEPPDALVERIVRTALESAVRDGWLKAGEVSLLLTDDRQIRRLNATYRNKDRATNVLSFPGLDLADGKADSSPLPGVLALGDVVMSIDRLIVEAKALEKAPIDHFAHLLVHGTLHLLGYDHDDDSRAEVMEALEAEILSTLGFAAPYVPIVDADDARIALSTVP